MKAVLVLLAALFFSPLAHANHGRFGLNAGLGVPMLTQFGADIYFADDVGLDLNYGALNISSGNAKADFTMPSALLKWHPLSGWWFVGAGVGLEKLDVTASDQSQSAEIKVNATTAIVKTGWMWGSVDGGLWFGIDVSYNIPTGAKFDITSSLPANSQDYKDAQDSADKFGKTNFWNITFAKIGYLF